MMMVRYSSASQSYNRQYELFFPRSYKNSRRCCDTLPLADQKGTECSWYPDLMVLLKQNIIMFLMMDSV